MSVEQSVEVRLSGLAEMVGPAQEGEAGSEQVPVRTLGDAAWGSRRMQLSAYQSEALSEPADNVEPIEQYGERRRRYCAIAALI